MALVNLYKVCYRYSSNQAKMETFCAEVVAAAGATDTSLGTLIKAQLPRGAANITVTEVNILKTNIIS